MRGAGSLPFSSLQLFPVSHGLPAVTGRLGNKQPRTDGNRPLRKKIPLRKGEGKTELERRDPSEEGPALLEEE